MALRQARKAHTNPVDWVTIHPIGTCGCPRCRPRPTTGQAAAQPGPEAAPTVELPTTPRAFRVHTLGRPPQDCTLHPDGTLTAVLNGKPYRNLFTFTEMLERNWANSRIEWDPAPLEAAPAPEPAAPAVQEAIAL